MAYLLLQGSASALALRDESVQCVVTTHWPGRPRMCGRAARASL